MSIKSDLSLAYIMGYDDALAGRRPDSSKANVLASHPWAECHDTHESRWFHCSECGFGMSDLYTETPWTEEDQPKYCPNCGRKIKED